MNNDNSADAVLIGGGIMSATVAALLNEIQPDLSIKIFERMGAPALESSDPMNNAGTGHAANCELNYTPQNPDGSLDISRALAINESFEHSLEFWAYLVEKGKLPGPEQFIYPMPHISFVTGDDACSFLKERHRLLSRHHMFSDMEYTEDPVKIKEWAPLLTKERKEQGLIAATRVNRGSDIDFGKLTELLFQGLTKTGGSGLYLNHEVTDLRREAGGRWRVSVKNRENGSTEEVSAGFVFIGGGGGSLPLLMKSGIAEGRGLGGMPVSGQWMVCKDRETIQQHNSKVYGRAPLNAPPMSVPHLDTRVINGQRELLFGPYAGFTTRYLKNGSLFDLPGSIRPSNIKSVAGAGLSNPALVRYLIGQVMQTHSQRIEELRRFVPSARPEDWQLENAGIRVQIIKPDPKKGGRLEFGTEVVSSSDGTIAALLGASPGASTAVTSMCNMILSCFSEQARSENWPERISEIVTSFGTDLTKDADLCRNIRKKSDAVLGLNIC